MHPHKESNSQHYCRLFRPAKVDLSKWLERITKLGYAMTDNQSSLAWNRPILPIEAGYTYFGQFIDHDLTKDKSSLDEAAKVEPHQLPNRQTPFLDLSHLYGSGPGAAESDELYAEENKDRFKLGRSGQAGRPFDIFVDPDTGRRILADDRSGENWILRQITAVFYRLHNYAAESDKHCDPVLSSLPAFERAKLQTTWQFQWLVRGDFLKTVLDPDVYTEVFDDPAAYKPRFVWRTTFSIPVEFSVAAFRFGHSMVRDSYKLSSAVPSLSLAKMFGHTYDKGSLPDEAEIEWNRFFRGAGPNGGDPITARPLDTQITDPLHDLPEELVRLFNPPGDPRSFIGDPPQLPVRTLRRGVALRLASGRSASEAFGISPLTEDQLVRNSKGEITEIGILLKRYGMIESTPLWYYILKESEVWHNGNCLGPTGSYIIAETIHAALRYDPEPFLVGALRRGPPTWGFANGNRPINTLSQLFREAANF